ATTRLNPEPYAYEGAFAARWLIQDQIRGDAGLNYDAGRGAVKAPLLLWGPYLWADGTTPRQNDGLIWERQDVVADGTHPSQSGKVDTAGYALLTLEVGGWKPDETTEAVVEYLLRRDQDRDHWRTTSSRPPSETSHFTTTYLAIRALRRWGTPDRSDRAAAR